MVWKIKCCARLIRMDTDVYSLELFHTLFCRVRLEKAKLLNTSYRITPLNESQQPRPPQQQQQQQQPHQQHMAIPITFENHNVFNKNKNNTTNSSDNYLKEHLSAVDYHAVRYLDVYHLKRNKTASCQPRQLLIDKVKEFLQDPHRSG